LGKERGDQEITIISFLVAEHEKVEEGKRGERPLSSNKRKGEQSVINTEHPPFILA